jgi:hypothetical protein
MRWSRCAESPILSIDGVTCVFVKVSLSMGCWRSDRSTCRPQRAQHVRRKPWCVSLSQPPLETGHMIFKLGKDVFVSDVCLCVVADGGEET